MTMDRSSDERTLKERLTCLHMNERFIGAALANFPRALMALFPPSSVLEIFF
jgi:hypothetical protein